MDDVPASPLEETPPAHPPRLMPASVVSLAILGILFALPGLLVRGLVIVRYVVQLTAGDSTKYIRGNAGAYYVGGVGTLIGFCFSLVLLVACIGALFLRPWARRRMVAWSGWMFVWATLWALVDICWLIPNDVDVFRNRFPDSTMNFDLMEALQFGVASLLWIFNCALSLGFLIFWERPRVQAAFDRVALPPS
jgi:hypothetical protein